MTVREIHALQIPREDVWPGVFATFGRLIRFQAVTS